MAESRERRFIISNALRDYQQISGSSSIAVIIISSCIISSSTTVVKRHSRSCSPHGTRHHRESRHTYEIAIRASILCAYVCMRVWMDARLYICNYVCKRACLYVYVCMYNVYIRLSLCIIIMCVHVCRNVYVLYTNCTCMPGWNDIDFDPNSRA